MNKFRKKKRKKERSDVLKWWRARNRAFWGRKNRQFRDSFVRSARKTLGATQDQVKNSFWKLFTRLWGAANWKRNRVGFSCVACLHFSPLPDTLRPHPPTVFARLCAGDDGVSLQSLAIFTTYKRRGISV